MEYITEFLLCIGENHSWAKLLSQTDVVFNLLEELIVLERHSLFHPDVFGLSHVCAKHSVIQNIWLVMEEHTNVKLKLTISYKISVTTENRFFFLSFSFSNYIASKEPKNIFSPFHCSDNVLKELLFEFSFLIISVHYRMPKL